jgi:ABC-type transport system involved in multi-copper enzyme maturation permease subunit
MAPLNRRVSALLWKELRQIRRNRAAVTSSLLMPLLLLLIVPLGQLAAFRTAPERAFGGVSGANAFLLAHFGGPRDLFTFLLLPLFVALAGTLVPLVAASYTVVAERERRSLDLLMALPVTVRDILAAKVLAVLIVTSGVVLPLFAINAGTMLAQGMIPPVHAVLLALVLLGALVCSSGISFVVTLLARDFRAANNLNGILTGPLMLSIMATLLLIPGYTRLVVVAAGLAAIGLLSLVVAARWITFERYLS